MPLPDANNYSKRIYELLKETDLENLSYAQFQGVAEKLFIEPENEDEMRRLVLVQLARMAVRGDWNGFLTGGGGSGGAPTNAEYVVMSLNGTLTNERVLTAGTGIGFVDAGAGGSLTVFNSGVTQLTAGSNVTVSSSTGGITIDADDSPVTKLIAGPNITLSPTSGLGDVTITASGSGGGGIGGSITDNQVAVGATATNDIEGSASLTYDVSTKSLNIAAGAGSGTVLSGSSDMVIRNSGGTSHSKITLGYDVDNSNIKLDTDGTGLVEIRKEGSLAFSLPNVSPSVNGQVLTGQTDGSTAWAASGGGSGSDFSKILPQIGSMTAANQYNIATAPPWGGGQIVSQSVSSMALGARPYAYPFIAPESGTVTAVGIQIGTADTGVNMYVGIYENDSNNLPSTRLGYATISLGSTGTIYSSSLTGTISLTAGEQYWYTISTDANVFNLIVDAVSTQTGSYSATPLGLTDDINSLNYSIKDTTVSANAVPPSTYSTDDLDGTANRIVVGLKF